MLSWVLIDNMNFQDTPQVYNTHHIFVHTSLIVQVYNTGFPIYLFSSIPPPSASVQPVQIQAQSSWADSLGSMIIPPCVRIEGCTPPSDSSMDDPDNHDADLDQCEIPWALEWGFYPRVLNPKIPMKNTFKSHSHTSHNVDLGMISRYPWVPIHVVHGSLFQAIRLPKLALQPFSKSQ